MPNALRSGMKENLLIKWDPLKPVGEGSLLEVKGECLRTSQRIRIIQSKTKFFNQKSVRILKSNKENKNEKKDK